MNKNKLYGWLAIVIISGCIGVGVWISLFRPYVSTNDALIDGFRVAVCPDIVTARIIKLYVDEGDVVKKGDLLCDLDRSVLESERIEALAKIATFETTTILETYNLEKIRNDFQRAQKGYQDGVVTFQQFDHAQKNLGIAQSKWEVAQKALEESKAALGVIEEKLRHTKITASINGYIVKRWMYEGDVPYPGQAIFSLYDLDTTWVVANLEETKMEHVRLGDPVEILIDAYPGKSFFGKIFAIKGAAASEFSLIPQDNATGNYTKVAQRVPLKISIDRTREEESWYLFPGLSVEVKIKVRP